MARPALAGVVPLGRDIALLLRRGLDGLGGLLGLEEGGFWLVGRTFGGRGVLGGLGRDVGVLLLELAGADMFSLRVDLLFEGGEAARVAHFLQEGPFLVRASFTPTLPVVALPLPSVAVVRLVLVVVVVAPAVLVPGWAAWAPSVSVLVSLFVHFNYN